MCAKKVTKVPGQVETTGHEWDGIEEYNNPLPRWWVWIFYATIIWGIGYTIAYPAWPLINGRRRVTSTRIPGRMWRPRSSALTMRTPKSRRSSSRQIWARSGRIRRWPTMPAMRGGRLPHQLRHLPRRGRGGCRKLGYPNLLDDDWLWGGDMEAIHLTITHGIRNTTDPDARYSEMPKFGVDELLDDAQIAAVTEHVLAISGRSMTRPLPPKGPPSGWMPAAMAATWTTAAATATRGRRT